jgi:co-chaperonin GroES (HSP10)
MTVRALLREIAAQDDPKRALWESVAHLAEKIEVFHHRVLVATYIEPETTPGGIIKPDRTLAENRFQGKSALVLRMGPLAFKDDGAARFGGVTLNVGDWIFARPSDGMEMFTVDESGGKGTCCRLYEDVHILGRLPDPAMIW